MQEETEHPSDQNPEETSVPAAKTGCADESFSGAQANDSNQQASVPSTNPGEPMAELVVSHGGSWQSVLTKFLVFEFALIPLAILLIYLCHLPRAGDVSGQLLGEDTWISGTVYGLMATIPLLALFVGSELCSPHWKPLRDLRELVLTKLMPVLNGIPVWGLLLISVGAGFGEEWFFRGFLQQLFKSMLSPESGIWPAILIVSLIFGFCHALSRTYFVITFVISIYFGYVMELTGSVLPAAVSHALYDFVALIYLSVLYRQRAERAVRTIERITEQLSCDELPEG